MASSDNDKNDQRHFRLAQAVLAGAPYEASDLGVSKMLNFVLPAEGADTWIARDIIKLRFVGHPAVHKYFLDSAPGIVWDLMGRMGVERIVEPIVGVARRSKTRVRLLPPHRDRADMVAWIVPGVDEIVIYTRPLGDGDLPTTGPIPVDGAWALPKPPPVAPAWGPPAPQFVTFIEEQQCPHCGVAATRYRELLDGALVCLVCSRSFERGTLTA